MSAICLAEGRFGGLYWRPYADTPTDSASDSRSSGTSYAGWKWNANGVVQRIQGSSNTASDNHSWIDYVNSQDYSAFTPGNYYEMKFSRNSGATSPDVGPALDTWLPLTSSQTWYVLNSGASGTIQFDGDIAIRDVVTKQVCIFDIVSTNLRANTKTYSMSATKTSGTTTTTKKTKTGTGTTETFTTL